MRSLKSQVVSLIMLLLLVLLLLLNTYPITSSRDAIFEEKKNSLSAQTTLTASALSRLERLESSNVAAVLELLELSGFSYITVTDSEGNVIYDTAGSALDEDVRADILLALSGNTVFRSDFSGACFKSSCAGPMYRSGTYTGAVCLYEEDRELAEIILGVQRLILTISAGVIAAALCLSLLFSEVLLKRIGDLVNSMKIVATGDYKHRLKTRGRDEVAELGNEFNLLTERLETNEKQRRRFVSDASHELKTPLASIRLLADSIVQSEDIDPLTVREFVSDIGNEAERLSRTTEKLLNLSRLDDDVQIVPEPVDVMQTVLDAVALLKPLADEKQVRIRCTLREGCVVMATVDDMFHIVFNLIENAVKYNVPSGSVTVRLKDDGENVILSVEDTGIGIPDEDMLNIFNRFYRVDKARSREAGGSGLGLSIVHDAAALHGGSITVGHNKPHGSVFTVRFPTPSPEETGI